jgi:hypothetical protein
MATPAVAPGTGGLDDAFLFLPGKSCFFQEGRNPVQPRPQRREIGHDQADRAAQNLRLARRQVHLPAPEVHPHVVDADHEVRIARAAQADDVEERGEPLVGLGDVHVLEDQDVAQVFGAAVELSYGSFHTRRAKSG